MLMDPESGPAKIWELPNDRRLRAFLFKGVVHVNQPTPEGGKMWTMTADTLEPDTSLVGADGQPRSLIGRLGDEWIMGSGYNLYGRNVETGIERCIYADDGDIQRAGLSGHSVCAGNAIYVSSYYRGVLVIDKDGQIREITRAHGLPSDGCTAIAASGAHGVWVASCRHGVLVVAPRVDPRNKRKP
jgi:hypothetical protein